MFRPWLLPLALLSTLTHASYYDEAEVQWNINTNQNAANVLEYSTTWDNHVYHPSPENWRMPFYSFFPDRFANGDPTNDNANGTSWEQDPLGTQLRNGGDLAGLVDSLDYLHGMGIRGLYLAGSLFYNHPWAMDGYSPNDHTLLDRHFSTLESARASIQAIHDKGFYVILDNTFATMSDLFAFKGYENASTPWSFKEHDIYYKTDEQYRDFQQSNQWQPECPFPYPRFYDQAGNLLKDENTTRMAGCMKSDFDQYGDVGAFGVYPEWQKQLSKFNGVQDRLRDWDPSVLAKIARLSCLQVEALDFDGFRIDKAMQTTVDSMGSFSNTVRQCAAKLGKNNFFIPGEVVNGNSDGAVYYGRGKDPSMAVDNLTEVVTSNNTQYLREQGHSALDAGAFHYTIYRGLMRFLGLDGNLLAANDGPVNFADSWYQMMVANDMNNAYTGKFDPRHMYGTSNQDVLRWPGLSNGTERQLLGDFITTLTVPGIPLKSWGEEQAFYTLDNTATNYVYGRQSMTSAQSWQMHGCYKIGTVNLFKAPFNSSLIACQDDNVSLDHRDSSHPVYGLMKQMYELRRRYPVLNDGFTLRQLSNQTFNYTLPGSFEIPTETGLYSMYRGRFEGVQDLTGQGMHGNQGVWLLYSNFNGSRDYVGDCSDDQAAIVSPFESNITVKNLFYPFDEWDTTMSPKILNIEGSSDPNGCLPSVNMTLYGWKAFVPKANWTTPSPVVTKFLPGHDARILSNGGSTSVNIEIRYSAEMDCDSVKSGIVVNSTTEAGQQAQIDQSSIQCLTIDPLYEAYYYGPSPSIWRMRATLKNVYDGIHQVSFNNGTSTAGDTFTDSNDRFMLRVGQADNVIVFPMVSNYSTTLLYKDTNKVKRDTKLHEPSEHITQGSEYFIQHKAAGADKWRYSMSFGAVWLDWLDYVPGNASLEDLTWTGNSNRQRWEGAHVKVQYWSKMAGSSNHVVEGDASDYTGPPRRFPHFFIHGAFNQYGYDAGLENQMKQMDNGSWIYDFMTEWPTNFQLNVWGMAADGTPDVSYAFGDVDNDTLVERISPVSLQPAVTNITNNGPEAPYLAWRILFNDADMRYYLVPIGNRWLQLIVFILLATVPVGTAVLGTWLYIRAFYGVKFNEIGLVEKKNVMAQVFHRRNKLDEKNSALSSPSSSPRILPAHENSRGSIIQDNFGAGAVVEGKRRCVLIGTMEYDISDWNIKIKIGGLGVMAQLMGKNLQHQDLVWVVPCAGGIDYPVDTPGLPIDVTILGRTYEVQVQYHKLANITYMLLDAPVFRRQTAKEPYPARMDDLDSAIYYSAWNQCIAEAMRRFPVDLYHINDYHGTVAPLYLLPDTVPCCLSLHNAEFQGLWPMRNPREVDEICSVFNLPESVVGKYVQFGEVFNLLHAGASILRIHQKGFGAVGVSKKYGKRSWARYPIFWGLKRIGALPNPDPSDIAEWDKKLANPDDIHIDQVAESGRASLKRQAQEWANLDQRADAELFVFVGRWSMQKGIDLIADVFPAVLEQNDKVQLMCIGPTIDLYGTFAALKLDVMMKKYPGRVFSKPEFTALPPFIFSGAEFALIPSRDEPFGLVAVEFGRKGALGVGSRVGGLGQMPGWWYTIESTTTKHQMHQFKMAIDGALNAGYETRAMMRARSAKQRFPVAQWKEDLEILQTASIKIHKKRMEHVTDRQTGLASGTTSGWATPNLPGWMTPRSGRATPNGFGTPRGGNTPAGSRPGTRPSSPNRSRATSPTRNAALSLGMRHGPGHMGYGQDGRRNSPESGGSSGRPLSSIEDEEIINEEMAELAKRKSRIVASQNANGQFNFELRDHNSDRNPTFPPRSYDVNSYSPAQTPGTMTPIEGSHQPFLMHPNPSFLSHGGGSGTQTPLSTERVVDEKSDKAPQELTPFFTDPTGLYFRTFEKMLGELNGKTSEGPLCIEAYLEKSEKTWFNRLHAVKMNRDQTPSASRMATPAGSIFEGMDSEEPMSQFLLPENYQPPTGIRRIMSTKLGDWPIYSFFLALGQILAANSYQITLLTGQQGQTAVELYAIAGIYLVSSLTWWYIFRRLPCKFVICFPWFFYGLGFMLLAFAPYGSTESVRGWVQHVATGSYAVGSAAGSFMFSQNFGSTGSAPVKEWAFRACAIQGTQQLYVIALWFWGTALTRAAAAGKSTDYGPRMTGIGVPISIFFWVIGIVLWIGLPDFYRQKPGGLPSFYTAALRRKIILWFFFAVFVQNFFLSAPYGRNWAYLWSSQHAPGWAIFLLILLFFVVIWAGILIYFGHLSLTHSWILPMFAVALIAPRWCQIWWGTSNLGSYLPWAGSPVASAILGRALWLWLGVLDSLQGVGIGMLLLQTLTRFHITFALVGAQVLGSIGTIIARADGLSSTGPLPYFPSIATNVGEGLSYVGFWVCLGFQILICGGYFLFFRKEQLSKP
nr:hypothetical protein B0A51_18106 [Rachicladosporium sp. CCFEE 5018]